MGVSDDPHHFRDISDSLESDLENGDTVTFSESESDDGNTVTSSEPESDDGDTVTSSEPESDNGDTVTSSESESDDGDTVTSSEPESDNGDTVPSSEPESESGKGDTVTVPTYRKNMFYNTNHKRRGVAVIFNQEYFAKHLELQPRSGTNKDCENLEVILSTLGFEIIIHKDLNVRNLISEIDKLGGNDFSDCDCLLIVVLSHGKMDMIYAHDSVYSPNLLFDPFTPDKCPSLAGKPKLFVIQAGQGSQFDDGIDVKTIQVYSNPSHSNYRIPLKADFMVAHSTISGYNSWRNTTTGSWFIQTFCTELTNNWETLDLMSILTLVTIKVAIDFESNTENTSFNKKKQIPCVLSMLTRFLKFAPKEIGDNATCNDGS